MLQLIDRVGRVAAEIFDGVLVAQPVRSLDGVVHVPAPVVLAHIAQAAATPPCAATVWLRVGNTLVMQAVLRPLLGAFQRGAQARAAGADHDDIETYDQQFHRRA